MLTLRTFTLSVLRQATSDAWSEAWSAACRTQRKMPRQSVAAAKASRSLELPGGSEPGMTQCSCIYYSGGLETVGLFLPFPL